MEILAGRPTGRSTVDAETAQRAKLALARSANRPVGPPRPQQRNKPSNGKGRAAPSSSSKRIRIDEHDSDLSEDPQYDPEGEEEYEDEIDDHGAGHSDEAEEIDEIDEEEEERECERMERSRHSPLDDDYSDDDPIKLDLSADVLNGHIEPKTIGELRGLVRVLRMEMALLNKTFAPMADTGNTQLNDFHANTMLCIYTLFAAVVDKAACQGLLEKIVRLS
jgi:hypothetical protein